MGVGAQRYEALHGGGGYPADRYITLIYNFIGLVFSLSTERLVQLRRVTRECAMNKTLKIVMRTLSGIFLFVDG